MKNRKNNILRNVLITSLSGALLLGAFPAAAESTEGTEYSGDVRSIVATTSASPRPFTYYDDNNELTGQNVDILNAIFAKLPQYSLSWEVTEFPSMFTGLDAGRYQIAANNLGKSEEREKKYLYTDAILKNSLVVIANKDADLPDDKVTYDELAGLTYIGDPNITYTTDVEQWNEENPDKQIKIQYSEDDLAKQLQGIQDGGAGYDFLVIDQPMFDGYYQPEFNFQIKELKLVTDRDTERGLDSYFILPKSEEQLRDEINTVLHELVADGTVKAIDEKYFGADYSPAFDETETEQ